MNPHITKGAPTLGVGVPMDSQFFKRVITGVKIHWIEKFLIPLKIFWIVDVYGLE
jgi:hypothetical protein